MYVVKVTEEKMQPLTLSVITLYQHRFCCHWSFGISIGHRHVHTHSQVSRETDHFSLASCVCRNLSENPNRKIDVCNDKMVRDGIRSTLMCCMEKVNWFFCCRRSKRQKTEQKKCDRNCTCNISKQRRSLHGWLTAVHCCCWCHRYARRMSQWKYCKWLGTEIRKNNSQHQTRAYLCYGGYIDLTY